MKKKITIAALIGILLILLTRRTAAAAPVVNTSGVQITPGKAYRAAAGYKLREKESPYNIFATTGSNANFYISGVTQASINGTLTTMAVVTYIQNGTPIYEWEFLIDINAFTGLLYG